MCRNIDAVWQISAFYCMNTVCMYAWMVCMNYFYVFILSVCTDYFWNKFIYIAGKWLQISMGRFSIILWITNSLMRVYRFLWRRLLYTSIGLQSSNACKCDYYYHSMYENLDWNCPMQFFLLFFERYQKWYCIPEMSIF